MSRAVPAGGDHPREVKTIAWCGDKVVMIDQRRLPLEEVYVSCTRWQEVAEAIRSMAIRGAPAIGVAAAMGIALVGRMAWDLGPDGFLAELQSATEGLLATRPTAYNLKWALREMECLWRREDLSLEEKAAALERRALEIYEEDIASCRAIGAYGAELITGDAPVVLTHCNAGALATAGYGTALGVIRAAYSRNSSLRVLVDETRPFLQGARLTAWELLQEGIPAELITDGMAGHFFRQGLITHVVVGADRIAANGDFANKIGTYPLSVLAREHAVPFLVAAPLSTVDLSIPNGTHIPIEERDEQEVTHMWGCRIAPVGVKARNPAFDVTPARNITAIITEKGVAHPPFGPDLERLSRLTAGKGGSACAA